jgi:hypothetical protein
MRGFFATMRGACETTKDREHRLRFPILTAIVNCPSISADGELFDRPGYDAGTGILFDPLGVDFPRVPDFPSKQQAEKALARLLQLLDTFDFVSLDDLAVALSLFSPPLRGAASREAATLTKSEIDFAFGSAFLLRPMLGKCSPVPRHASGLFWPSRGLRPSR